MTTFLIKVSTDIPYPWEQEYRVEAGSHATAILRACKLFKKEQRVKGRRISIIRVHATKLI